MARLVFKLTETEQIDFDLNAAVVTLGRADDNDIVINNSWISSHHARFVRRLDGGYEVIDLGSHNGTAVNGERVKTRILADGDIIGIGQLDAVYEADRGTAAAPPPPGAPASKLPPPARPGIPHPAPARPVPRVPPVPPVPPPPSGRPGRSDGSAGSDTEVAVAAAVPPPRASAASPKAATPVKVQRLEARVVERPAATAIDASRSVSSPPTRRLANKKTAAVEAPARPDEREEVSRTLELRRAELAAIEREISEAKKNAEAAKSAAEAAEQRAGEAEKRSRAAEDAVRTAESRGAELEKSQQDISERLAALAAREKELVGSVSSLDSRRIALEAASLEQQSRSTEIGHLIAGLAAQKAGFELAVQSLRSDEEKHRSAADAGRRARDQISAELAALESALAEKRSAHAAKETELTALRLDEKSLTERVAALRQETAGLESQSAELAAMIETAKAVRTEIAAGRQRVAELDRNSREAGAALAAAQAALQAAREDAARIERENDAAKAELDERTRQLGISDKRLEEFARSTAEFESLKASIVVARAASQKEGGKARQAIEETKAGEARLATLRDETSRAESQRLQLEAAVKERASQLAALAAKIESAQADLTTFDEKGLAAQSARNEIEQILAALAMKRSESESALAGLAAKVSEKEARQSALDAGIATAETQVAECTSALAEATRQLESIRGGIRDGPPRTRNVDIDPRRPAVGDRRARGESRGPS